MFAHAELPNQFNVYTTSANASSTVCRALFAEYDKVYSANTIIVTKSGATGMLAMIEMTKDKNFSMLCGSGLSESVINTYSYPGNEDAHKLLTMVTIIAESPTVFSTRPDSPYNTLPELMKSGKSITVGYNSAVQKLVGDILFESYPVVWVPYKASTDALSSLLEGTLDLYIDGGGLTPLITANKLKSLGHFNGLDNTPGINLKKEFSEAAKIRAISSVTTSINNNASDIEEMNQRINKLMNNEIVINAIKQVSNLPLKKTVKESNDYIEYFRKEYIKKYVR